MDRAIGRVCVNYQRDFNILFGEKEIKKKGRKKQQGKRKKISATVSLMHRQVSRFRKLYFSM